MRVVIISILLLLSSFQLYGQNVILYSYDSAGHRTPRDTTSTNIVLSPSADGGVTLADRNATLAANIGLPSRFTFGEDVISEEGTSPRVKVWTRVMGKIKPIESHLPQKPSSGAHNKEEYE